MISVLRTIAQDETLLRSLDILLERSILQRQVHGVALGFDAFWLSWISAAFVGRHEGRYGAVWNCGELYFFNPGEVESICLQNLAGTGWRPPLWKRHCLLKGYGDNSAPVLVKIITRDQNLNPNASELPTSLESRFGSHPVIYEYRPACVAVAATAVLPLTPSVSIGQLSPPKSGTLGGFLKNTLTNQYYATSCAHVLGSSGTTIVHPGPSGGSHPPGVGTVDIAELPPQVSGSQMCNSRSSFVKNRLDLSVASVDLKIAQPLPLPGYPSGVLMINQMCTGQNVIFDGHISGPVNAKIDDLNLWRTVLIDKNPHCFGDIFSIVPRKSPYLNLALAKPGDSGSWVVLDNTRLPAWAGMVVANDGLKAYCCFAEHIVDRVSQHFGGTGTCVLP
jgi:hypothetical protein